MAVGVVVVVVAFSFQKKRVWCACLCMFVWGGGAREGRGWRGHTVDVWFNILWSNDILAYKHVQEHVGFKARCCFVLLKGSQRTDLVL